jgi:hypothetical protein
MLTDRCPTCGDPISLVTADRTVVRCPRCRGREGGEGGPSPDERAEQVRALAASSPFGRAWDLGAVLGAGATGVVFRARPRDGGADVALKVLARPEHASDLTRFQREAALLAQLSHPHVVSVIAAGTLGPHPYLALELMEGGTLRQRLAGGTLPVGEAIAMARGVLAGLEACHAAGVVHRDVKPENVLFDAQGRVKIGDFGIAKPQQDIGASTRTGALIGTPRYMAPEQVRGQAASAASDVYAVGLMLYESLLGGVPHLSENLYDLLRDIVERDAVPLADAADGVPEALSALVQRAVAKDARARVGSAREMAAELERIDDSLGIEAKAARAVPRTLLVDIGAPAATRLGAVRSRTRAGWAALAAMGVCIAGLVAWLAAPPRGGAVRSDTAVTSPRPLPPAWWTHRDVEVARYSIAPRRLALAGEKGELAVLDAKWKPVAVIQGPPMEPDGFVVAPDASLLAMADKGEVFVVDVASGRVLWNLPLTTAFSAVSFCAGARLVAIAGREPKVQMWNARGGAAAVPELAADARVRDLAAVEPDGMLAVLTDVSATVHDPVTGKALAKVPVTRTRTLAASPDGKRLAIGGDGSVVTVVEWRGGKTLAELGGHRGDVMCVAWSPDGQRVATCTRDGRIALYDAADGKLLGEKLLGRKVESIGIDDDGWSLVGSAGKSVTRWSIR